MKFTIKGFIWICLLIFPLLIFGCTNGSAGQGQNLPGSISGRVYFDQNADKNCEECECGLADVRINLFENTCSGTANQTALSDVEGNFSFVSLAPGDYCIFVDLPPTCDGYQSTTSISQQVVLHAGEEIELDGFGFDTYVDSNQ